MSMRESVIARSMVVLLILGIGIAFYVRHRQVASWERYGIELIPIPAGNFEMGDDDDPYNKDNLRQSVYLDSYSVAKNLVTVKQYEYFCTVTGHKRPESGRMNTNWDAIDHNAFWRLLPSQLQPYTDPNWHRKHDPGGYPVTNVSRDDANAYCRWLSQQTGRKFTLPTEAQWEKAARGTDRRKYPWGDVWDANRCANSVTANKLTGTMPVGSYPSGESPYGVRDMAGNVWQWCANGDIKNDANGSNSNSVKGWFSVLRGGSYCDQSPTYFGCAYRDYFRPSNMIGFRCVSPGR